MKYLYSSLVVAICLTTSSYAALLQSSGEPNRSALVETKESVKQAVSTNINQVMIEMLTGVKNASGEIYKFSKQEIGQGYDFLKAQAPEVVKEFLAWQIAHAIVWIFILGSLACLLFYFARQFKIHAGEKTTYNKDDCNITKWIFRVIACIILVISIGYNSLTIAKIVVAPRVFIIEYVVELCKSN